MNRNQRRTALSQDRRKKSNKQNAETIPENTQQHADGIDEDFSAIGDNAWGDVENVYRQTLNMAVMPAQLRSIFEDPSALNVLEKEDYQVVKSKLDEISSNYSRLRNELKRIRATHEKRKGDSQNGDDLVNSLNVAEQYYAWQNRFQEQVIAPTSEILALFNARTSEKKREAHNKANPIPSVNYKGSL